MTLPLALKRAAHTKSLHHVPHRSLVRPHRLQGAWAAPLPRYDPVQRSRLGHITHVFGKLKQLLGPENTKAIEVDDGPEDDDEGSDMARIDTSSRTALGGTSADAFGPMAILMAGYMQDEFELMQQLLRDMEADMIKLIPCTKAMLPGTLGEALQSQYVAYEQPPLGQRRTMILSGMYGSEVVQVISEYKEAGLPPCAFAGAVPNNINRQLEGLLQEVQAENQAMAQRMQEHVMNTDEE